MTIVREDDLHEIAARNWWTGFSVGCVTVVVATMVVLWLLK